MADNTPEIAVVTSETLQAKIRELLPSQQGFGNDLQASNVIIPVVDLTAAAEGSALPVSMQQSLAFGSQTAFDVANTTTTIISGTGFYRVVGGITVDYSTGALQSVKITMSDGISTKTVYQFGAAATTSGTRTAFTNVDLVFFLSSGDSVSVTSTSVARFAGSSRQIADVNGNLVNPSGFVAT